MERLLVTGMDTVAGANLAIALADHCDVLALYDRVAIETPAVRTAAWYPEDPTSLAAHFSTWHPQWVIHCGPLANSNWDPAGSACQMQREPLVVKQLAELAHADSCALTVLSSDTVFGGPRMFQDETSPATNPSEQAEHTRVMERMLEDTSALVVRTHLYGWSPHAGAAGFAQQAWESLLLGRSIPGDGHHYATPILVTDLAALLWRAYELRLRGRYHLAGAERTSMHHFAHELAASLGVAPSPSTSVSLQHAELSWPEETSLSSKCMRRMLSAATPMLREGIDRFVAQAHSGWRSVWRQCGEVRHLQEAA